VKCTGCRTKLEEGKLRCPKCGKWATLGAGEIEVHNLSDVRPSDLDRIKSGPWDLVWGGGIVTDSVSLFAGQWGAGKSTLLLQIAQAVALQDMTVLYVSREETLGRIKSRALRLTIPDAAQERIKLVSRFTGSIRDVCEAVQPKLLILDSLSALVGVGLNDVREAVEVLTLVKDYADEMKCPGIVVSHINKKGEFSGPEAFAHLIDSTIFFRKDKTQKNLRHLMPEKNRDGDVDVRVSFSMTAAGLIHVEPEETNAEDEEFPETD